MAEPLAIFKDMLRRNGVSVTRARIAVFERLLGREPQSMHELIAGVSGTDRASVYRTVELFEQLGIVQRVHTGWKYKLELSDSFGTHHHHLTCTKCGKTTAINEAELEQFITELGKRFNFTTSAHQIELQGICHACTKQP